MATSPIKSNDWKKKGATNGRKNNTSPWNEVIVVHQQSKNIIHTLIKCTGIESIMKS